MEKGKKTSLALVLIDLVQASIRRFVNVIELASLEAKLAVRTLFNLTILFFVLTILLISTWLSLLVFAFFYFISLGFSSLAAAGIIALINVCLLMICCFTMWKMKRNLFFPSTRKQLGYHHGQSKKTN